MNPGGTVQNSTLPIPAAAEAPEIAEHFDGLRRRELVIPQCRSCGKFIWYPRPLCSECDSTDVAWVTVAGSGEIYSYTWVYRGEGEYQDIVPFAVAYVDIDEGPRILTNVIAPSGELSIGTRVQLAIDVSEERAILRFRVTAP
jgi:uncharacterized protein